MSSVLKPIQTLKEYFWCHVYCTHLGTPWYQIVGASRTISTRESRYPRCGATSQEKKLVKKTSWLWLWPAVTVTSSWPWMSPAIGTVTSICCVHHSCTFPTSSSKRVYCNGDIWDLNQLVENNQTKQNKTVTDSKGNVSEHRAWERLSLSSTTFAPIFRALCFNF